MKINFNLKSVIVKYNRFNLPIIKKLKLFHLDWSFKKAIEKSN